MRPRLVVVVFGRIESWRTDQVRSISTSTKYYMQAKASELITAGSRVRPSQEFLEMVVSFPYQRRISSAKNVRCHELVGRHEKRYALHSALRRRSISVPLIDPVKSRARVPGSGVSLVSVAVVTILRVG